MAGVVFSSDELWDHWDQLDAFEGDEYERIAVEARLDEGGSVTAQVYALRE